jgi:hypothetical protein
MPEDPLYLDGEPEEHTPLLLPGHECQEVMAKSFLSVYIGLRILLNTIFHAATSNHSPESVTYLACYHST